MLSKKVYHSKNSGLVFALYCVTCLGMTSTAVHAGENFHIPRVHASPKIDGYVDKAEWKNATRVRLDTEVQPAENKSAPLETQALLMEDGETLYVAFVAQDPDTSQIRAYYRDHDQSGGHDNVGIVLDTFNDERQAYEFLVNPLGVQRDGIRDGVNNRYNAAWDGLWESAGKINDDNYTVEMAIPLDQLRFVGSGGIQTWGVDLVRLYPRDKNYLFSSNPRDRNVSCYLCQLQKADGFEHLEPGTNIRLTPAVTAIASESREDPAVDRDWVRDGSSTEASLDLRWGISQNLYLNATLNPDFSQVEADDAQLNVNSTYSLYYPERRSFFLDGASYFNSKLNVVHTRNIAEPDYGLKLTGKSGAHSYGFLTARDSQTAFIIPGDQGSELASLADQKTDVTIGRYRYDLGANSTLGFIATDRRGEDYSNSVFGIDGTFQLAASDRLEIQGLRSRSKYPDSIVADYGQKEETDGHALVFEYQHQDRRWNWYGRYDDLSSDFRADLGFVNRVDHSTQEYGLGRTWNLEDYPYTRLRLRGIWEKSRTQDKQDLSEASHAYFAFLDGPMQSAIEFGGGKRERFYDGTLFDEDFTVAAISIQPLAGVSLFALAEKSNAVDFANTRPGESQTYRWRSSYQIGRHLNAGLDYTLQRFTVDEGLLFTARLLDLRVTWQFTGRSFLRLSAQHSDTQRDALLYLEEVDATEKDLGTQLLYSYKLNAQSRFYLGYSDAGFQDDGLDRIEKSRRTVFLKASYAWQ